MKKHLGVVVSVTMIGVAAVVVSQAGMMGSGSMRGQLVPDDMMSSTSVMPTQNYQTSISSSSGNDSMMPASDGVANSVDNNYVPTSQSSMSSTNNDERWDCVGIRDENERMCNTLKLDGTLLCGDGERDCKDTCTWPVPFNYMCEHQCDTARADCEYQLEKKVSACNDRTSASFLDCLEHNSSLNE